jgi:hypothetical protein
MSLKQIMPYEPNTPKHAFNFSFNFFYYIQQLKKQVERS